MKKRFITALAAATMLCSSLVPSALADDKTTINILWWGSQTRHEKTVKLIEKFEELNPDIKVNADYSDWGGYWTKLPAQVAGGQTPDVFQMDYLYLAQYAENNVLAELDSYIADGSLDMSDVSDSVLRSGQINGKTYAISTGTNGPAILYRRDLVEQAGVELPMNPTMSEYIAVAKAVYETSGMKDNFVTICSLDNLRLRLRNYELDLYNDDDSALGFDDPKYIVDMWSLAIQAQDEGWGIRPGEATDVAGFDSMVVDTWSRYQYSNELQAYRDATGKDIGMVMIPNMDDATAPSSYLKPSMFWCVAEQSENKEAAIRFINFFTNNTECFDICGLERAVPISSKMREHLAPTLDGTNQEVAAFIDFLNQPGMVSPLMRPAASSHSNIADLFGQYTEQVRYGMIDDLEATARQFMDEANAILAEAASAK